MSSKTVAHGVVIVTHVGSKKVFIALTQYLDYEKNRQLRMLKQGEHSNKELQELYDKDPDVRIELLADYTEAEAEQRWCDLILEYRAKGRVLNALKTLQSRFKKLNKELPDV